MNAAPSLSASIAVRLTALTASAVRLTAARNLSAAVMLSFRTPTSLDAPPLRGNSKSRGFRRSSMSLSKDVLSITYQHGGDLHNSPYGRWRVLVNQWKNALSLFYTLQKFLIISINLSFETLQYCK